MEANKAFLDFRKEHRRPVSDVRMLVRWIPASMWCSDWGWPMNRADRTCLLAEFGRFNYGTAVDGVLAGWHDLPEIFLSCSRTLCIGEIANDHNNSSN